MKNTHPRSISLDEIAGYSAWPSRLLSLAPFELRNKSSVEVEREFGDEKWGRLLELFKDRSSFILDELEAAEQDLDQEVPVYHKSLGFYLTSVRLANIRQIKIYQSILSKYAFNSNGLVELGAGYGSKIIRLSNHPTFKKLPLAAAEYTKSGCDLIKLLAQMTEKDISVGRCDFSELEVSSINIPKNSIIFTSYSVHYVPHLKENFVDFLNRFNPRVVVHFEPCYEHFDPNSLHGLMCKRYMDINGYTKNIASNIIGGCNQIGASVTITKNIFGSNPFLPFSVIEWIP
jgi:hypothetical protein